MLASFIFKIIVLAILSTGLWVEIRLRRCAEEAQRRARERSFPVTPFDTSTVAPQVQRVRLDYLAATHARSHHAFYQRQLLAVTRRVVTCFSFFHHERSEPAPPEP